MWKYIFKQAAQNMRRSKRIALLTLSSLTVALLVMSVFFLIALNAGLLVGSLRERTVIVAYLQDRLEEKDIEKIKFQLKQIKGITSFKYISKDSAYKEFKESLGARTDILTAVPSNPLPASFDIKVEGHEIVPQIASHLKMLDGIEDVDFGSDIFRLISRVIQFIQICVILLGIVFGFFSILVVTNTVKLGVYARQDEIEILKLVGATPEFIRAPFLVEGAFHGIVSSTIALTLLYLFYLVFVYQMEGLKYLPIPLAFFSGWTMVAVVGWGGLLGTLGSFLAVEPFVKM